MTFRATLLALTLLATPPENTHTPMTTNIRLDIVPVLDATPRRFVFVLGGVAYETKAGLFAHVEAMPKGSTMVLDPGCRRMGGEPLIDSESEMAELEAHAKKHGVNLKVIPAG
jgi:hypothetical protein